MKMQKVLSHKEVEDDVVSESCSICKFEIINIEEICSDLDSGNYYCEDCAKYNKLSAVKCKDID